MIDLKGQGKNSGRRVKAWQVILGVLALVLVPSLGNTFAGAITVNAGQNVEFGQGKASAAACDPAITITPTSAFVSGNYKLETITITNLELRDTATVGAGGNYLTCLGKTFKLQILDGSSVVQEWIASGTSTGLAVLDSSTGSNTATTTTTGITVSQSGSGSTNGTLNFHVTTPYLLSSSVSTILIQTQ